MGRPAEPSASGTTLIGRETGGAMQTTSRGDFAGNARFEVRSRVGQGAVGVVYEALDRERNARIALKTLRLPNADTLLLLKNEFRTVQDLRHPNLVHLGELFEENGQWFFTMEFVNGVTFIRWVRPGDVKTAGSVPPPSTSATNGVHSVKANGAPGYDEARLRSSLQQLARGLEALHRADKVHRDVKPSNILVTPEGRVVILDFGVVSDVRGRPSDDGIIGTAAYMAPEQAVGEEVGPAADWYAMGVILYQALTGRLPFEGSGGEMLERKLVAEPPPPRTLVPTVPRDLDELCCALLRLDPADRPRGSEVVKRLGVVMMDDEGGGSAAKLFVGRAAELDALEHAFVDAARDAVSVVVDGESGVGKSCLVRAFTDWVRRVEPNAIVFGGRCYERESVPYKAVDHVIDDLSRFLAEMPEADLFELLPPNRHLLPRIFPVLRRIRGMEGSQAPQLDTFVPKELRARVFDVLRELFVRLCARQRVVVTIDDVQWADGDSQALLGEVLRAPGAPNVLLVLTRRTGENARAITETFALPGDVRRISVGKLAPSEARELVARMVPASAKGDVDAIAAEAMGHPLFIDELVRQRGTDARRGEPIRLDDALWARVSRLDEPARRLVELLAVAGLPITQEAAAMAAAMTLGELFDAVSVLRAAHLARTDGTGRGDAIDTYHDRVRESVLARLTDDRREAWHRKLAEALETRGDADAERLAVHWQCAGDAVRAAKYAASAADEATRTLAFDRAVRLYRLALSLREDEGEKPTLLRKLADALTNAGRLAEAAATRFELAAISNELDAIDQRRIAAEQLLCSGHFDEGMKTIRATVAAGNARFPETPLGALFLFLFYRLYVSLRGIHFRERDARAIDPRETMELDVAWSAGRGLLMTDTIRGIYFQTLYLLMALRLGEPERLVRALAMSSLAGGATPRPRARNLYARAKEVAARVATPEAEAMVASADGGSAYFWGEWARALEPLNRAEELFRDRCFGSTFELNSVRLMLFRTLSYRGALRELAERVAPVLREAETHNDLYAQINARAVAMLMVSLAADDPARVRDDVEKATTLLSGRGFLVQHYLCLFALVQADLYDGRSRDADARLQAQLKALKKSMLLRIEIILVQTLDQRARIAVAIARERGADAAARLAEAEAHARALDRIGNAWATALATAARAAVAAAKNDEKAAIALLRAAEPAFEAAGMTLHAWGARRILGEWLRGDEGAKLVEAADAWMTAETIVSPAKMARLLVPASPPSK